MASAHTGLAWNPLSCSGAPLAPNVLLAAKLVTLCALAGVGWTRLAGAPPVPAVLAGVAIGTGLALLLNRRVQVSALLSGAAILVLAALVHGALPYVILFAGLFLLVAGAEPGWLRWLTAAAYLAFAVQVWGVPGAAHGWPIGFAAIGLLLAAFGARPLILWAGLLFHFAALIELGGHGALFSLILPASYLAFAQWPTEQLTVLYDGDCGFCETTRRFFERLDIDRLYDWQPFQSGAGDRWGISRDALAKAAHVVVEGRIYPGFRAFQAITLFNPLTYLVLAALLLAANAFRPGALPVVAALALALYFPLFRPLGEAIYQLIARNRHRLPGEKTCKIA
ncbi:MAG: DUF393 domain-containing protein [Bryobacterales bacterium]